MHSIKAKIKHLTMGLETQIQNGINTSTVTVKNQMFDISATRFPGQMLPI